MSQSTVPPDPPPLSAANSRVNPSELESSLHGSTPAVSSLAASTTHSTLTPSKGPDNSVDTSTKSRPDFSASLPSYQGNNRTAEKLAQPRGVSTASVSKQPTHSSPSPAQRVESTTAPSPSNYVSSPSTATADPPRDQASLSSRVNESVYSHHSSESVPAGTSQAQSHSHSQRPFHDDSDATVESNIRSQLKPVTNQQMTEALQLIQYDVHREVHAVIREQVRQFAIAKVSQALLTW